MITTKRTNSEDPDFLQLVTELDKELAIRNGESNDFFAQFNKTDHIKNVVVIYEKEQAAGCGAMKQYAIGIMEIKRMFVPMENRRKGLASRILLELENWANELGYGKCILETGNKMPEALALYKKSNFNVIPNYPPYTNVETSICFEKIIS